MTRIEKMELLNVLLELEEKNDIGNLTRSDRAEFQMWVKEALEQDLKRGHWIEYNWYDTNRTCRWGIKCNQCNKEYKYGSAPNYCPNCGAKMNSEVDNGNDD